MPMTMAGAFTGLLMLTCRFEPVGGIPSPPVTIRIRDAAARISGLDDASVEHGLVVRRGPRGALRLTAVTPREPETDIWADLVPRPRGTYDLVFRSAPHGTSDPGTVWAHGRCIVERSSR